MEVKPQVDKKALRLRADKERGKVLKLFIRSGIMPPDVATLYKRLKKTKPVQVENYVFESTFNALKEAQPAALDTLKKYLHLGFSPLEIYERQTATPGDLAAATRYAVAAYWMTVKGLY